MGEKEDDPDRVLWKALLLGSLFVGVLAGQLSPEPDQPPFGLVFGVEVGVLLALVLIGACACYRSLPRRDAEAELDRALHSEPPTDPALVAALVRLAARRREHYRQEGHWILVFGALFLVDAAYRAFTGDWLHAAMAAGAGALAPFALVRMHHLRRQLDELTARLR